MEPDTITHLQFIQNIIDRMNRNSFQIKEWCVGIVSAFLALYANSSNPLYIYVAVFPVVVFWFLDSYYLQQERKFRGVYGDVVSKNEKVSPFQMPIQLYKGKKFGFLNVLTSKTLVLFYGTLIVCLTLVATLVQFKTSDKPVPKRQAYAEAIPCRQSGNETVLGVEDKQPIDEKVSGLDGSSTNATQLPMTVKTEEGVSNAPRKDN